MKFLVALPAIVLFACGTVRAADEYRQLLEVKALPSAPDPAFSFRKTKQYLLADAVSPQQRQKPGNGSARDPSIGFERSYRLYGAVTALDQRRRYGDYLDFFWRAQRPGQVTVRFEYRQEKLRGETQAREVNYPTVTGSHKTSFAVIGDDFFNDGRILAWRCLLIENGRVVAEKKSYLWR